MKTIGLYLAVTPNSGGMYQYSLSIIKALDSLNQDEFKIIAFCQDKNFEDVLPDKFEKIFFRRTLLHKVFSRIYCNIDRTQEGLRRFSSFFNPTIKEINRSKCDLVIYPGQDVASYQANKPSLSTIHDLMHRYERHFDEYQHGQYQWRERHYKNICKYSKGILVDSKTGKQHVIESYNINPEKVHILPFVPPYYLLNSRKTDVRKKYNLKRDFIFYPAQFWVHKNHITLLESLKILKDKGIDIDLVLVGGKKNNYKAVITKISKLKLENNVHILGYVSNDEIYSLYKEALALTYVSSAGPTNIPPLEAMLLGCPVIAYNVYAMPEQIGDAGLFFNPLNPKELALHIEDLLKDNNKRELMINNGYNQIEKMTQNSFNEKLGNIITGLVSDK